MIVDRDLSELYGVETRALLQAVKRNIKRFPLDFMFQLSPFELNNWRSHFVMSNPETKMSLRRRPYVFTEQGVAMLASVLRSQRAIEVNIAIVRTFVLLREILSSHKKLQSKLLEMEKKYDYKFQAVFEAIRQLMAQELEAKNKRPIGFKSSK